MGEQLAPPRWAKLLASLFIRNGDRETLLAELEELYSIRLTRVGRGRALGWYLRQAMMFPMSGARLGTEARVESARGTIRRALTTDLVQDTRYALRGFARSPGFSLVAVVTLAVGIGATTLIFGIVDGILLRPLQYHEPGRLVSIALVAPGVGPSKFRQSAHTYVVIDESARAFDDIGAWTASSATVTGVGQPERVPIVWVTEGLMNVLGIRPNLGRSFNDLDGARNGVRTVILDHRYWVSRLGEDPAAVGRTLTIDGEPHQIVGVLDAGVTVMDQEAMLYLPFVLDERAAGPTISFDYNTVGRLSPGVTLEAATAEVDRVLPQAGERFSAISSERMEELGFAGSVYPLKETVVGDASTTLWLLLGAVSLVMLIVVANVANLFLVRASGRRREVAVRTALGAAGQRLGRQFVLESLLLSLAGGAAGVGLAALGLPMILRLTQGTIPRTSEISLDPRVLGFSLSLSVITAIVFGLAPLARLRGRGLASELREGDKATASRRRLSGQQILAVAEVSLALTLVIGAGLLVRTMEAISSIDPGFSEPAQVVTFRVSIPRGTAEDPQQVAELHEQILQAISAVPGVSSAGAVSGLPLEGRSNRNSIMGRDPATESEPRSGFYKGVAGDYFEAMGIPLLAGRGLDDADRREGRLVGLVNEAVANRYWGSAQAAIGKFIRHDTRDPWREIVGVVGNVKDASLSEEQSPGAYWPTYLKDFVGFPWIIRRSLSYAVRVNGPDPLQLLPSLREAVWSVDPSLPLASVATQQDLVDRSTARTTMVLRLLSAAALVAVLLGAVGVYGVMAFQVSQRTREIGIRLALGARTTQVRRLVLVRAGTVATIGVILGLVAAGALSKFLSGLLFGVATTDPYTYGVATVAVIAAALMAGYLPALRASRVDPISTLRAE